jgi:hypothetical protein
MGDELLDLGWGGGSLESAGRSKGSVDENYGVRSSGEQKRV